MEKIAERCMLYDFYGELLTTHQRKIYEDAVYHDLSLGEIAQDQGISRQGVHDLIKRCNHILDEYEAKLKLVERFLFIKESVSNLNRLADSEIGSKELKDEVKKLSAEILKAL